jgi:dTDP-4-amino-4,6-dideoxygalactose transaminase
VSNLTSGFCEKRFQGSDTGDIRFQFDRVGYSSKMNELEAAVGLGALEQFEEILSRRRRNLKSMLMRAEELKECLWTFSEESFERIGPHALPLVVSEEAPFSRNELIWHLEQIGVDARTLFSSIPTQCAGYRFLRHSLGEFPNAERIGRHGLHIGVHQDITDDDIDWLFDALKTFARRQERKRRPPGRRSSDRHRRHAAVSAGAMGSRSGGLPT